MLAAFGAGALVGAIVGGSVGRVRELGWVTVGTSLAIGVGFSFMGVAPSVPGGHAASVRWWAWASASPKRPHRGLAQARTPESMIGRVMSLVMMGGVVMSPLSLALAGVLVDLGAATPMYIGAGVLVIVTTLAAIAWGVPQQMREA